MLGKIKRWGLRVLGAAGVCLLALIGYLGVLHFSGNFHTVVEGELYRSAQVKGDQLATYTQKVGIKSVLNLRGPAPGSDWYDAEMAESARLGLTHADYALSASTEVTSDQARELIALMQSLPKPILVHCKHGSDRTGLISALYLAAINGQPEDVADDQLSIKFGHFAVPYLSAAYPMDESWDKIENDLQFAEN